MDVNDVPAVEVTTGFFKTDLAQLLERPVDGDRVDLGGAAYERLPTPANRKVYSDINTAVALTAAGNQVVTTNAAITTAVLGLGAAEAPGTRQPDQLDARPGHRRRQRRRRDDGRPPRHGRPDERPPGHRHLRRHRSQAPNPNDGVVYAVTNEGYLHAIDTVDGHELWAFMPNAAAGPRPGPLCQRRDHRSRIRPRRQHPRRQE